MKPEDKHLMTIGEAVKALGVTRRMILNYEDKGLLKPDLKNGKTGNRYYTADSVARILTIRLLQNMGLSLDEIRAYYEGTTDMTTLIARMEKMRDDLNLQIEKLKLHTKEKEELVIETITLPEQVIYCETRYATELSERKQNLREAFIYAMRYFTADYSKRLLFTEYSLDNPNLISNCVSIPSDTSFSENVIHLPEQKALAVMHHGSYETIPFVIKEILAYAKENQIPLKGTARHTYLEGPPQHSDPSKYITQVALLME